MLLLEKMVVIAVILILVLWHSSQLNQTLSDAGHIPKGLTVLATNLQFYTTVLAIVAEFDGTTDTSIFTALLHNVERRSVHRQASGRHHSVVRRAATAGVVNATTGYVADGKHACTPLPFTCVYGSLVVYVYYRILSKTSSL